MSRPTLKRHDRYQLEIKTSYVLLPGQRTSPYELDLYFFAPKSLGIHRDSYPKQQFYTDMQSYIRLKTPEVGLNRMYERDYSPLANLRDVVEKAGQDPGRSPSADYERHIKLFCSILKTSARNFIRYIKKTSDPEDRRRLSRECIQHLRKVREGYRDLRPLIQQPNTHSRTLDLYLFGDEYISLLVEDYIYRLMLVMNEGTDEAQDPEWDLLALAEEEVQYRKRKGYPSIASEGSDNEVLLFRLSVLKKFMASILFLYPHKKRGGVLLEQTLFGFAAATAMIFATLIAFISQSVYGNLTMQFFLAIVIGYIFKDRIKDLLKVYLSSTLTRRLFDHKIRIRDVAQNAVGVVKESFDFTVDRKLPKKISELRDRDHITEIENDWTGEEQILVYRKRIRLKSKAVKRIFPDFNIQGVTDIMRFSVKEFLRKMDDPKKELFIMDEEGYQRITGTRVYHLNLIVRFSSASENYQHKYRVVLNRKGIKRIESVGLNSRLGGVLQAEDNWRSREASHDQDSYYSTVIH